MKNLEKILMIAVFVVPVVICAIVLKNIWSEDEDISNLLDNSGDKGLVSVSGTVYMSGDEIISNNGNTDVSGEEREMGGKTFVTTIGDPISKIYSDAEISAAIVNVYSETSENAEVIGSIEKYTKVTAQRFPSGWSRVNGVDSKGISVSGWIKTANISYPDNEQLNTPSTVSTGVVTAEPYLNVRMNPSTTATILTKVNKGETVTIEDSSNGWHKITVNGVTGWVSADYVK